MSSLASSTKILALICIVAAVCLLSSIQVTSKTVSNSQAASSSDMIDLFPSSPDCKQDEEPSFGVLPTCEQTCQNKKPACPKVFVILDYVPCFCKKGLFRDTATKKCVKESECTV